MHYHAYGDGAKVPGLVAEHSERIRKQIDLREEDEVGRLEAEYQTHVDRLVALDTEIAAARAKEAAAKTKGDRSAVESAITRLAKPRVKLAAKLAERDERIDEARRRAEDDRQDVARVGHELVALYADPEELLKHARIVGSDEIQENEFNLNIPRYVDTFQPEPRIEVKDALKGLAAAEQATQMAEQALSGMLRGIGYAD